MCKKRFTIRINDEIYKKMKIKATLKDMKLNDYINSLIIADVDDMDLSGIVKNE